MAYPALRTTKEDDNIDFSFLRRQLFTSDQAASPEREFLLRSVHSAQNVFLRRESLSQRKRKKETLKCPSSTREDTNSQRPTHVQALSGD